MNLFVFVAFIVGSVVFNVQASLTVPEPLFFNTTINTKESANLKISRDNIINRAQDWVNRAIPYSQSDYTDGYRQDCSGMVSMAWQSSTSGGGHSTYNMQDICYRIDRSQLQRGDAILKPSQHVLLFDYWVNGDAFMQYAEIDWGRVATHNQVSMSYFESEGYFPCRFNNVN